MMRGEMFILKVLCGGGVAHHKMILPFRFQIFMVHTNIYKLKNVGLCGPKSDYEKGIL